VIYYESDVTLFDIFADLVLRPCRLAV